MKKSILIKWISIVLVSAFILTAGWSQAFAQGAAASKPVTKPVTKPIMTGDGLIGTYRYVGGKLAGYDLNDYFKNTGAAGTVTIKAVLKYAGVQCATTTKTFSVKAGKKYSITLSAGLVGGGKAKASSEVILSSPSMTSNDKFEIEKTMISSLGDIKVEEIKYNADLAGLKVYAGSKPLAFEYDGAGAAYVDMKVNGVTVVATADDVDATVAINGQTVKSGVAKAVSLKTGDNEIKVTVTSPDKTRTTTKVLRIVKSSTTLINKWEKNYGLVSGMVAVNKSVYAIAGSGSHSLLSITADGKEKKLGTIPEETYGMVMGKDGTFYTHSKTKIYALKSDGSIKWTYNNSGYDISIAANGTVYVVMEGGKIYALSPEGKKLWEYNAGGIVSGIFTGPDNMLFYPVTGRNGSEETYQLCALRSDGTKAWEYTPKSVIHDIVTGTDGLIYVAAYERLLTMDPVNGNVKSEIPTEADFKNILLGKDGTLFIIAEGYGKKTPTQVGDKTGYILEDRYGLLCAYNKDGAMKWEMKSKGMLYGFAFTPDGDLVVSSEDHMLIRVNSAGVKKQEYMMSIIPYVSPVITSEGFIYYEDGKKITLLGK